MVLSIVREWVQRQEKPTKEELKGQEEDIKVYAQMYETLGLE